MSDLTNHADGIKEYEIVIDNIAVSICLKRYYLSNSLIIFFHGLGCSREIFNNVLTHPLFEKESLLLFDFPGFGKSAKPDDFSYSMEDQAIVCEKLIELFPTLRLHIVAHSMGGAVPLLFSDRLIKRIDSFANLEGNLTSADCTIFSRSIVDVSFDEYSNRLFEKQKNELARFKELQFDETTPLAMYKSSQSLVEWSDSGELLEKFESLNCKKIYFFGEKNKELETIKELDRVTVAMIPNAGHSMMLDNPDDFYKKLYKFIFE